MEETDTRVKADHDSVKEAFELTAALVNCRSYPGEEAGVQKIVADWFRSQGLAADVQMAAPNRPNIIVRVENGSGPTFLLNGHVDTVLADANWSHDPWQGRRDGDRFFGLGACDMKSGVAAAMIATRNLAQHSDRWNGTLLFTSVVDEEAYSIGANALIDEGVTADFCVVTESSWDHPCLGAFGKYLVRVDVEGKGAHASWPESGVNAAVEAARFVTHVVDERPIQEADPLRDGVGDVSTIVHEVHDLDRSDQHEVVGEQSPMATPPERFAAHHRGRFDRVIQQLVHTGEELIGSHVVGVGPERCVAQGGVA